MSNKLLLQTLFSAHKKDLLDVISDIDPDQVSNIKDHILCPICLGAYGEHEIEEKQLTDGHIWPKNIRQRSKKAQTMRILLCASCNHNSGSRGDAQMQILQELQNEENLGHHRERKIQIAFGPGTEPVLLNMSVTRTNKDKSPINANMHLNPSRNNPEEMNRFNHLTQDRKFSLIIPWHNQVKPKIARVGWLTAAYLMAFYTFGYRYILHLWLEPVRKCILDSFKENEPTFLKSDILQVNQCNEHDYDDPNISVIVPIKGTHPVYIQVDFWNYHIRLPFHFNSELFRAFITMGLPDDFELPVESDGLLGIEVQCTKTDLHECDWDYILGKPFSDLSG